MGVYTDGYSKAEIGAFQEVDPDLRKVTEWIKVSTPSPIEGPGHSCKYNKTALMFTVGPATLS